MKSKAIINKSDWVEADIPEVGKCWIAAVKHDYPDDKRVELEYHDYHTGLPVDFSGVTQRDNKNTLIIIPKPAPIPSSDQIVVTFKEIQDRVRCIKCKEQYNRSDMRNAELHIKFSNVYAALRHHNQVNELLVDPTFKIKSYLCPNCSEIYDCGYDEGFEVWLEVDRRG